MPKVKKYFLPGATAIFSLYISFLFAIGVFLGYLGTTFLYKRFIDKGIVRSQVKLKFGKWQIHCHHWLMGATALLLIGLFSTLAFWPKILLGFFGGVMFHDLNNHGLGDLFKVIEKRV